MSTAQSGFEFSSETTTELALFRAERLPVKNRPGYHVTTISFIFTPINIEFEYYYLAFTYIVFLF